MENIDLEKQARCYAEFLNRAFKHDAHAAPATKKEFIKFVYAEQGKRIWLYGTKEKHLAKSKTRFKQAVEIFLSLSSSDTEKIYFKVMMNDIDDATNAEFMYHLAETGLRITERFK